MTSAARRWADRPAAAWLLAAAAFAAAAVAARPLAGGWNDGSRLATVESLLDRQTLAIDDSLFCRPPAALYDAGTPPYPPDRADLRNHGTLDKLFVGGHFYSDKPAVVSVLMAGAYRALMAVGLPGPAERPDVFCRVLTALTGGLAYAAAVGCLWALGRRVGLPAGWRLAWLGAFAFGTVALAYTEYVNNHAMHLGVTAGVCVLLARAADFAREGRTAWGSLVGVGTLTGLGFNLDLGSGPPLVGVVLAAVGWRTRRAGPVLVVALAALPWVAAGLGVNYALGGGWKPVNMYPGYFTWPGSPFTAANLTGYARRTPGDQLVYALALLFGKKGFLVHNLPLLLALAGGAAALRRPFAGRAELVALLGWCGATWLLYAVLSNNSGGACLSVRWFVPFLAPGFWLLAVVLRDQPARRPAFLALAAWGCVLGGLGVWAGPWAMRMVPLFWPVVGAALLTWAVVARRERQAVRAAAEPGEGVRRAA